MAVAIYEYDEPSEEFLLRATDHMEEELITALRQIPAPSSGDGAQAEPRNRVRPKLRTSQERDLRCRECVHAWCALVFAPSLAVPLLREDDHRGPCV